MEVLILHDAVAADAPPDAQDTLVQVDAVARALRKRGHRCDVDATDGDLEALAARLRAHRPERVFNLVESLAGSDAAAIAVPALLDGLGIAYTGSPAAAIALANDKCIAKRLLVRFGLPTPPWFSDASTDPPFEPGRYIAKARFEHASKGLEADAIGAVADVAGARALLDGWRAKAGLPCFAERFVDGREFNLSLLERGGDIEVLPPAEIDFSAFPAGTPRMVGYKAKWVEASFEFRNTPRRFDFAKADEPLVVELVALARTAFRSFGLRGYARVDFRVDEDGPWILELNANPCLAPDAGYAAALDRANIAYDDAIERILLAI